MFPGQDLNLPQLQIRIAADGEPPGASKRPEIRRRDVNLHSDRAAAAFSLIRSYRAPLTAPAADSVGLPSEGEN
ncbi:hypothetical protein ASE02_09535 [Phenylobacterium sp. Root700]|nr:hypothetical protein ASE02_09535 [Phenylobacterium sp. Root700]